MRVTHIITRLIVGGAQENTVASVLGLRDRAGVNAELISGATIGPEGSIESAFASRPELLTIVPELVRPVDPAKDLGALRRLTELLKERQPDIVHTHSGKAGIIGRLAARRAGVRVIIHTVHGPSFGGFQGAIANAALRAAERFAGRVTTHFVVVANAMRDQYLAAGIGRPEQYTRIFSGFDIEPFLAAKNDPELRSRFGIGPGDIVIGKIARLFKLKGHDDLFTIAPEIIRRIPTARFLLVGDGMWRTRFEETTRTLGLEKNILFAGLVPPSDVPRYVGIMDMLVHLSRREGLARALPQALGAGKPVIAYDCDGAPEVCVNNETGFLVPPTDLSMLKARLFQLAGDIDLRRRLGATGRQRVRDTFSIEKMVDDLHRLYRSLL